ncbi:hypothetical protein EDD53_1024 [Pacificibacter maritimus]|uniref:Uncharacterized protein n=1 Tax=Pacificibacter maritimus TaxID=762213 RepID=A0A3N4UWG0_9RHOB|nr:hypothetical protein EDD53_1024 [Pacificibacter maritimus]
MTLLDLTPSNQSSYPFIKRKPSCRNMTVFLCAAPLRTTFYNIERSGMTIFNPAAAFFPVVRRVDTLPQRIIAFKTIGNSVGRLSVAARLNA